MTVLNESKRPTEFLVSECPGTISRDEVAHLARLARLAVTDRELDLFAGQLDVILGAVARVGEVAADEIPPTSHEADALAVAICHGGGSGHRCAVAVVEEANQKLSGERIAG